jgi:hypothetical protein
MNRKFWISLLAVFVVNMLLSYLQHGMLLRIDYTSLPNLMRTEQDSQAYFGWMLLGQFLICGAFVWIYQRGKEDKSWPGQGLRFGLAAALISTVPHHLIYHAVAMFPTTLMIKQVIYDLPVMLCMGLVVAWLNR